MRVAIAISKAFTSVDSSYTVAETNWPYTANTDRDKSHFDRYESGDWT